MLVECILSDQSGELSAESADLFFSHTYNTAQRTRMTEYKHMMQGMSDCFVITHKIGGDVVEHGVVLCVG